jgi:hypothetical protein
MMTNERLRCARRMTSDSRAERGLNTSFVIRHPSFVISGGTP